MLDPPIIDLCREYTEARCSARAAFDRRQRATALSLTRVARQAYANGDRASWPYLEAIKQVLITDLSLTDPDLALRRAGVMS
jgi:hypothetical protein